jgi:uncharacterized iron-regulated protein
MILPAAFFPLGREGPLYNLDAAEATRDHSRLLRHLRQEHPLDVFMLQRAIVPVLAALMSFCPVFAHSDALPPPTAPLEQDHPLVGRIFQSSDNMEITPSRLADLAAARDFVLLGEKHDNPDHHSLQAWMIGALTAHGTRPAVAMEMLDADQAESLSSYLRQHPHDASGLGAAVRWSARGWPDWSIYAPIADAALRAGLPIVPADLTQAERRIVSREGIPALPAPVRRRLQASPVFDERQAASLAQELRDSHCGRVSDAALPRMADVQWARDAHMASVLLDNAFSGAVLIAGAGHVRRDRGVPWHLQQRALGRSIAAVAFVEVEASKPNVTDYARAAQFDFVWFTARVDNLDPCARFRQRP